MSFPITFGFCVVEKTARIETSILDIVWNHAMGPGTQSEMPRTVVKTQMGVGVVCKEG
jgi:hypothetical protein